MPYADKLAITQSPERLKTFKLKASQQQIEANIQLYNSEHAVNKQSSGDDFGFAGMAKRMKSS
jgi:hypothetical protein